MIKRDGVSIMNDRTKNVSIAKETIEIIKNKKYTAPSSSIVDLSLSIDNSIKNSVLYKENPIIDIKTSIVPTIEVINESTTQAAIRLLTNYSNIVALNFASARNVGGGFISGAIAQEEDLCRKSALYFCMKNKPIYYNENILRDDSLYTDHIIYSPNVPFFRDEYNLFLENPYELSIISAPAPNVRGQNFDDKILLNTINSRILKILKIAAFHKHETIILGAWGCGAFGNDPYIIASSFKSALEQIPLFKHVCFAILSKSQDQNNISTFKEVFS